MQPGVAILLSGVAGLTAGAVAGYAHATLTGQPDHRGTNAATGAILTGTATYIAGAFLFG